MASSRTLADAFAMEEKMEDDCYVAVNLPLRAGNAAPIAYGGFAVSFGVRSAYRKAPAGYHLYSALGHFLRGVSTEAKLMCRVTELRSSKGFVTYRASVLQKQAGAVKCVMEIQLDFHKEEPSMLSYSPKPLQKYSHWRDCKSTEENVKDLKSRGKLSAEEERRTSLFFGMFEPLCDTRQCPEGIMFQNLSGVAKATKTTQDNLGPTEKTSAAWLQARHSLHSEADHMAGLAFLMDAALGFLPLTHNHLFLEDAGACASLDFALRLFTPHINMNDWYLREMVCHQADSGRSFSESRVWDERGNMIVSMSQQSILRVKPDSPKL